VLQLLDVLGAEDLLVVAERIEATASRMTIAAGATFGLVASDDASLGYGEAPMALAGIVVGAGVFSTLYYRARRIVRPASGRN
jgi:O-antigen/teichoic acid export membrane protein